MQTLSRRLPIRGRGYSLASQACGPLACNMFALICEATKEAVLVDPSFQSPSEFEALREHLDGTHGAARLTHVLLTHGHPDHVAGVAETMRHWPDASLHLHAREEENYRSAREVGLQFGLDLPSILPTPTHELQDGDVLKVGDSIELVVVHTPGHAPGHVAFVDIRQGGEGEDGEGRRGNVLMSGDLLFNGSVGRTDWHNASVEDLHASLRRVYELCDDESIVLSGHTTPTYLKRERQSNPFVDVALRRPEEWYQEAKERHEWQ